MITGLMRWQCCSRSKGGAGPGLPGARGGGTGAAFYCLGSPLYERTTRRYGERGYRYVCMEVGYILQNIYLQDEALQLATVAVGAFDDAAVKEILAVEGAPLLFMPVGAR